MTAWEQRDDASLLAGVREGSHPAFAALARRHAERFRRVAYRFTGSVAEAEDIVQEALLKLWENPSAWREGQGARFTTWFYRVVVNRCLDARRKKTPLPLDETLPLPDPAARQDDALADAQLRGRLEAEIARLPERQRIAINLCFLEELSNQEAADVMGVRLKALQSLVMRAKATLRERLRDEGESHHGRGNYAREAV